MQKLDLNKSLTGTPLGASKQHYYTVEDLGEGQYRFETSKRMTPFYVRPDKQNGLWFIHNTVKARLSPKLNQRFTSPQEAIKALVKFSRQTKQTHEAKRYWYRVRRGYHKEGETLQGVKPRFHYKTNRK